MAMAIVALIVSAGAAGFLAGWACWKKRIGYTIGRRTDIDGGYWSMDWRGVTIALFVLWLIHQLHHTIKDALQ